MFDVYYSIHVLILWKQQVQLLYHLGSIISSIETNRIIPDNLSIVSRRVS